MDKRTLLAVALMAIVIVVTPMLFPSAKRRAAPRADSTAPSPAAQTAADSTAPRANPTNPATNPATQPANNAPAVAPVPASTSAAQAAQAPATIVPLATAHTELALGTPGAVPVRVTMKDYRDLRRGEKNQPLVVEQPSGPLLHYRLALGADTIALDTVQFHVQQSGTTTTFSAAKPAITISYEAAPEGYRTAVRGTVAGAPPQSALIIDLPSQFRSAEADTVDDYRHLAYGYKVPLRDVSSTPFSKLDPASVRADTGSFQWVSARDKYWLVALMQPVGQKPAGVFRGITMRGAPRAGKLADAAYATTLVPLDNGHFAFDLYIGPQSWQDLHALGNDLENVNPYAGWLHAIVQPFATIMLRILLWMKSTLPLSYGWILVLFGVVIRLLLWPLNQKAMRTSIQMQRLQPELTAVQKRYKEDPKKQQEALMKLYQEHGMSPISPMLGCLPMLLPMPILYALYFVFQNTIAFRGVPFLWLPDLSLRDPYYIIPILMGASMFLLSWIGMRAAPPNPQTKMMSYMMPAMFTVIFFNFASGLNLYYAVQNIAALPQQWIITKERAKAGTGAGGTAPARRPAPDARRA